MIKEYLRSGIRVLVKNKISSLINVMGLSLGIASSLILFVVIKFELSFDTFHANYSDIYRITHVESKPNGDEYDPGIYYPMSKALRVEMPDLAPIAMVKMEQDRTISILKNGAPDLYQETGIGYAEQEVFFIFDFQFVVGNEEKALTEPKSVVISESMAEKYFGGDALGKEITIDRKLTATVTGIYKDFPDNTDFPFRMVFRFDDLEAIDQFYSEDKWNLSNSDVHCYFLKPENMKVEDLNFQIGELVAKNRSVDGLAIECQPLSEIHFDDRYESLAKVPVSRQVIWSLGVIGLILIITACINFINLTTAQSIKRSRETGIRKVLGSSRIQLISKYLLETAIVTLVSILLSLGIAELSMNQFKDFIEAEKDLNLFNQPYVYGFLGIVFVMVSLLSGLYPAYVVSKYTPSQVIKTSIQSTTSGFWSFRKGLVLIQFVISQILIVCAIVVLSQLKFFNSQPLGFESDQVIIVPLADREEAALELFRNEALSDSRIMDVTYTVGSPLSGSNFNSSFKLTRDSEEDLAVDIKTIDEQYINLYGLELLAGRNITTLDSTKRIIVNERMLSMLDWTPADAVGKNIFLWGNDAEIVGVVKDFYNKSLQEESNPIVMLYLHDFFFEAGIKVTSGNSENYQEILAHLDKSWQKAFPGYYFDYEFLDTAIAKMYETQQRLARLINSFTFIAIFISALGLYGLILFMATQRTKEIGVRKVLGASVFQLVRSFVMEFIIILLVAAGIAAPVSYTVMDSWLSNFAYRIDIGISIFMLAFGVGLLVALVTVGFRSYKAAIANPVNALRNE